MLGESQILDFEDAIVNPMIAAGRSNRLLNNVAKLPRADYNGSKKQSKQLSY